MGSLIIAIISNTVMIFSMKYAEKAGSNAKGTILWNYILGTVAALALSKGFTGLGFGGMKLWTPLVLGFFNAILMTACMLIQQKSISINGAGMTTTYNRLGVLIPTVLSIFLFQEYPTALKICGIVLSAAAIMLSYERDARTQRKRYALLAAVLIFGGLIDFNSKILGVIAAPEMKSIYTCGTFFFSAVIMMIVAVLQGEKMTRREIGYGALIGIPNIGITFGMVGAASQLPAYIVFPVYSGAVILLVNGISMALLKEQLTKREMASTAMIGVALVLLNL